MFAVLLRTTAIGSSSSACPCICLRPACELLTVLGPDAVVTAGPEPPD